MDVFAGLAVDVSASLILLAFRFPGVTYRERRLERSGLPGGG